MVPVTLHTNQSTQQPVLPGYINIKKSPAIRQGFLKLSILIIFQLQMPMDH